MVEIWQRRDSKKTPKRMTKSQWGCLENRDWCQNFITINAEIVIGKSDLMRVNMATTVLMHCWQPIHKSKASMPVIDFHWNFYFINFFFHLEWTIGYVSRMHKWFIYLNWIVNEWARLQIIHSSIDANAPIEPDSVHLSLLKKHFDFWSIFYR